MENIKIIYSKEELEEQIASQKEEEAFWEEELQKVKDFLQNAKKTLEVVEDYNLERLVKSLEERMKGQEEMISDAKAATANLEAYLKEKYK